MQYADFQLPLVTELLIIQGELNTQELKTSTQAF